MPDPKARDPHTLNFDQSGILWFTAQNANMMGRIDPSSGEVKLVTSPTPNSRPYGLTSIPRAFPSSSNSAPTRSRPSIPGRMAIKEYALPNAASRPRRLALAADDMVWYADYSRGYLGRLDLATGEIRNGRRQAGRNRSLTASPWRKGPSGTTNPSRSRTPSCASIRRRRSSRAGRFPGGGDIVRNMDVTPNGNPVTANSLVNQVGMVEVE